MNLSGSLFLGHVLARRVLAISRQQIGRRGDQGAQHFVHRYRALVYLILTITMCNGCGDGDRPSSHAARKADLRDPCSLLSDGMLRRSFDIALATEVARESSKYTPHPHCTVTWRKPDADEIEQRQAEALQEYLQRRMRGENVDPPTMSASNRVALTLFGEPRGDAAARAEFEGAMRVLADGFSGKHDGVELTFQADLTPVVGIGQQAMWAARLHQLSVLSDSGQIFHLVVETGLDASAELEAASEMAAELNRAL
jgi:hypothetical protein